ncbi:hypothetical protein [Microbulbifer sp. A4B17]|nr:hypothetical protein [Microbulbifer sp. A4B17]
MSEESDEGSLEGEVLEGEYIPGEPEPQLGRWEEMLADTSW